MNAAGAVHLGTASGNEPLHVTLLELVQAVTDVTDSEVEVVATVLHMLRTGRVCLTGSFRRLPVDAFS